MIHAEKASFPVTRMTELLDVSTSGYYAWAERQRAEPGPLAALAEQITGFHKASDGVNGAPRILADLREAGQVVSRKAVAKIMAEQGIQGISPRPWTPATTIADDRPHSIPDLVKRRFDTGELNRVWPPTSRNNRLNPSVHPSPAGIPERGNVGNSSSSRCGRGRHDRPYRPPPPPTAFSQPARIPNPLGPSAGLRNLESTTAPAARPCR